MAFVELIIAIVGVTLLMALAYKMGYERGREASGHPDLTTPK